ncbi:MAG: hypothetical protein M1834_005971 [Cirrosporium novae-zelandiae]|nr:MAG: hypothetical protein M1834_005971 [Cirrosporium novae-zelandiae]
MEISYESIVSSHPFRFILGPNKRVFTIHAALAAHHSKVLAVLVNGPMCEAKEQCAYLEDVNEQTFVRFSQYIYTGEYDAAEPGILLDESSVETVDAVVNGNSPSTLNDNNPDEARQSIDEFGTVLLSSKVRRRKKGRVEMLPDFLCEQAPPQSRKSLLRNAFSRKSYIAPSPLVNPQINIEPYKDFTPVFLSHAELYVFGDRYNIPNLQSLALHNLCQALDKFILCQDRIGDIIELMRYTYSNTADRAGLVDELRDLVVHYAACVVEDLQTSSEFGALLEEVGALGRDLVRRLVERLD